MQFTNNFLIASGYFYSYRLIVSSTKPKCDVWFHWIVSVTIWHAKFIVNQSSQTFLLFSLYIFLTFWKGQMILKMTSVSPAANYLIISNVPWIQAHFIMSFLELGQPSFFLFCSTTKFSLMIGVTWSRAVGSKDFKPRGTGGKL